MLYLFLSKFPVYLLLSIVSSCVSVWTTRLCVYTTVVSIFCCLHKIPCTQEDFQNKFLMNTAELLINHALISFNAQIFCEYCKIMPLHSQRLHKKKNNLRTRETTMPGISWFQLYACLCCFWLLYYRTLLKFVENTLLAGEEFFFYLHYFQGVKNVL